MRVIVLLRAADPTRLKRVVERAEHCLAKRVGAGTPQSFIDEPSGFALLQAETPECPVPLTMHTSPGEAFTYAGFVNQPNASASSVRALVDLRPRIWRRPQVTLRQSPGGMAGFFWVDAKRSVGYAWSSLAGAVGIFYTVGPHVTAISNSPMVSHLVGHDRDEPAFCELWGRRILLGDYTLWDDTPYEGTFYTPPRSCLCIDAKGIEHLPHPIALDQPRYESLSAEAVEELMQAALASMNPLHGLPTPQIRLSGGKDSRLVAALARRAGLTVETMTFTRSARSGEALAAQQVAEFLGLPHHNLDQEIGEGTAILDTMAANLRRSEGLLNENRQLAYVRKKRTEPLLEGQAHHPRGGFRSRMLGSFKVVRRQVAEHLIGDQDLAHVDLVRERESRIAEILDGYRPDHAVDLHFWTYADWRSGRWHQACYQANTAEAPLFWPMMDERVLEVCWRLGTWDRVSEHAFFAVLARLAPGIERVPLYNGTWVFDKDGAEKTPFPEGFAERNQPIRDPEGLGYTREKRLETVLPLVRLALTEAKCSRQLHDWIRPEVVSALLEHDAPASALGIPNQRLVRFAWKVTAIALVLDGEWLR